MVTYDVVTKPAVEIQTDSLFTCTARFGDATEGIPRKGWRGTVGCRHRCQQRLRVISLPVTQSVATQPPIFSGHLRPLALVLSMVGTKGERF